MASFYHGIVGASRRVRRVARPSILSSRGDPPGRPYYYGEGNAIINTHD